LFGFPGYSVSSVAQNGEGLKMVAQKGTKVAVVYLLPGQPFFYFRVNLIFVPFLQLTDGGSMSIFNAKLCINQEMGSLELR
jgi:hypothetical protein